MAALTNWLGDIDAWELDALHLLVGGANLNELLASALEFSNQDFMLFDGSLSVVAHASRGSAAPDVLERTLEHGYADGISRSHLRWYEEMAARHPEGFEANIAQQGGPETPVWVLPVQTASGRTYTLHAVGPDACREDTKECTRRLAGLARLELERLESTRAAVFGDSFVTDLFTRSYSTQEARKRMDVFGWTHSDTYVAVAARSSLEASFGARVHACARRLEQAVRGSHAGIVDGDVAALLPWNEEGEAGLLARLDAFARELDLRVGVSDPFTDLVDCQRALDEAVTAATLPQPSGPDKCGVNLYDDCKAVLLSEALRRVARGRNVVPANLSRMRDYDCAHDTRYVDTLRTLLACSLNRTAACERLSIHRNTLDYRTNRMLELFGVDVSDTRTRDLARLVFAAQAL